MLYSLILNLIDTYSFLNVFKYLTVRTGLAVFTSLLVVFLIGNPFINFFSAKQILNPIRDDGPDEHIVKKIGTPTMGGVLILIGLFFGIFKGYVVSVCIFSILNWFYPFKNWGISAEDAISFNLINKGSEILIEEFPSSEDFIDTKEKIEQI